MLLLLVFGVVYGWSYISKRVEADTSFDTTPAPPPPLRKRASLAALQARDRDFSAARTTDKGLFVTLKAKFDKVNVQNVLSFQSSDLAKKLQGQGSVDLSADGQGLRWEDIAPRLIGQLNMGITDGKLLTAKLGSQVIGPILQRVGVGNASVLDREMAMRNLTAQLRISDGRLHANSPIRFTSDEGVISLGGSIGLDKRAGIPA